MQSQEIHHLIFMEQHKDRIREIERQQLLKAVGLQSVGLTARHKVAGWLGAQMVRWGAKLQNYDTTPAPKRMTIKMHQ